MRLTLRTLLAYLDDTLEPAQAKLIGQKVAESDTAQELIARIRQVTRRRRLTTPPATGPGSKLDPNTIAAYLDNALSVDQLAEVEQTCLGSDVHLAEIAACHQILTLVLGEPALIPPTSRQRMYGLVKGPEAIPFRKPPSAENASADEVPEPSYDTDETLRLGLPAYRAGGGLSNHMTLIGGASAAALLLILSIWMALRTPETPEEDTGRVVRAQVITAPALDKSPAVRTSKEVKTAPTLVQKTEKEPESVKTTEKSEPVPKTKPEKEPEPVKTTEKPEPENKTPTKPEPIKPAPVVDVPVIPASTGEREVGTFLPQAAQAPSALLERKAGKMSWRLIDAKKPQVYSGRSLVSLPGFQSVVRLNSGLRLTLWGNLREQMTFPPVQESRVELHHHDDLDLDLTLKRGRIVLSNPTKKSLRTRLRFDNPANPARGETWDITLEDEQAEVLVDLWGYYPRNEKFFKDREDLQRVGPSADLHVIVLKGNVSLRRDDKTVHMEAPPGVALQLWNSLQGSGEGKTLPALPAWTSAKAPPPQGVDLKLREQMLAARDNLALVVGSKPDIDLTLTTILNSPEPLERMLAVRCFGALDDLPDLVDALGDTSRDEVRLAAVDSLRSWIAAGRENDYRLLDELQTKYKKGEAEIIMFLLHNISQKDAASPETYETLAVYLDNSKIAIRELARWHLYLLAPGFNIRYAASADQPARQQARDAWLKLITSGQLPPRTASP